MKEPMNPKLMVKISKRLNTLKLTYLNSVGEFDIIDGEIDLIQIDQFITEVLKLEYDKVQLRKRLGGESD